MNKVKFEGIFFGSTSAPSRLVKIASELKGTCKGVIEAHQLAQALN